MYGQRGDPHPLFSCCLPCLATVFVLMSSCPSYPSGDLREKETDPFLIEVSKVSQKGPRRKTRSSGLGPRIWGMRKRPKAVAGSTQRPTGSWQHQLPGHTAKFISQFYFQTDCLAWEDIKSLSAPISVFVKWRENSAYVIIWGKSKPLSA
jgi:hypothetical protein